MSQETRWLTLTESVDLNGQVTREIHVNPLAKIVGVNKYICAYLLLKERRRTKKKVFGVTHYRLLFSKLHK